jgi:hypothetical protein
MGSPKGLFLFGGASIFNAADGLDFLGAQIADISGSLVGPHRCPRRRNQRRVIAV